ncbi:hypothetical protein J6V85_02955 [Candidatus Saccharibacteria bacterium]|nr:hypothetical protein [Candidatus Saccharibacteria bacterium]
MKNPESNTNNDAVDSKTGWESLSTENFIKEQNHDFEGERNINDKTGKERTFVQWDLYPKLKGETNEQYGARLKFMNQKTAEYEAEQKAAEEASSNDSRPNEYLSSEHGKKELAEEEKFDRLTEKVEKAIAEGRMSAEHGKALLERQLERSVDEIEGYRQDYEDSKSVGTPEEQAAYEKWLKGRDAENQRNLQKREKAEELTPVEETLEETSEEVPNAEENVEEAVEEVAEEKPAPNLDPEVQYWLNEELKDLDEWAEKKNYSDERKASVEEELRARAGAKQEAIERERQEAIEKERREALEEERQAAIEEEKAAAGEAETATSTEEGHTEAAEKENNEAEAKGQLIGEIESLAQEIEELESTIRRHKFEKKIENESEKIVAKEAEKAAIEAKIAAIDAEIAVVDAAIEDVKKKKRPSFGLLAWLSSRIGKNRKKTVKPVELSAEGPTKEATFDDAFEDTSKAIDSNTDFDIDPLEYFKGAADYDKDDYHFWTSIGEKGIDIMTATGNMTEDREKAITEWWDSLEDKTKETITKDFKYKIGKPLRVFLQKKKLIPEDTGDYFREEEASAKRLEERAEYLKRDYNYWNAIGDEGLKYITGEETPNDDNKERILTWWNALDNDTRNRISNISLPLYRKLVTWIQKQQEASPEVPQAA